MKILVTSPDERIGRRIVSELIAPEFSVRVILREPDRLAREIREQVEVIRGSMEDALTLRHALDGVESLFWCVPTESMQETDIEHYYERFACAGWKAIRDARTPRVVTISAGREGPEKNAGRITGLQAMEEILNETGAALRHLRCGLLMEDFLSQARNIWQQGVISYPMPGNVPIPMASVADVADSALRWLVRQDWDSIEVLAVHGESLSLNQAAAVIERTLKRPVRYVETYANDYVDSLVQAGASVEYARGMVEMFSALAQAASTGASASEPWAPTSLGGWAQRELVHFASVMGRQGEKQRSQVTTGAPWHIRMRFTDN